MWKNRWGYSRKILTPLNLSGAFEDDEVTHVDGDINPVRDLGTIFEELRLKDVEYLRDKTADMEKRTIRSGDKKALAEHVSAFQLA